MLLIVFINRQGTTAGLPLIMYTGISCAEWRKSKKGMAKASIIASVVYHGTFTVIASNLFRLLGPPPLPSNKP